MRFRVLAHRLALGVVLVAACDRSDDGPSPEVVRHVLTTTLSGDGTGTVSSTPAGIDCGADCSEPFVEGTAVTLHASAGAGSIFLGWTGAGCAGTGDCVVDVAADATVDAAFGLSSLSCTYVTNADYCTNGPIPQINLGPLTGTECHAQCEIALQVAGVTSGCWILAVPPGDGNCYCRSGVLATGSTDPGGTCN